MITRKQYPNHHVYEMEIGGRTFTVETGKVAELANAECKIAVCPADTIEIVSKADTIIMHYAFYIHHSKRATMGRPFSEYLTYGYPA